MSDMHDPFKNVDPWERIEERRKSYKNAIQEFEQTYLAKGNIKSGDIVYLDDSDSVIEIKSNYVLESGQELTNVHNRLVCENQPCAIHHASDHPLAEKPRAWANGIIYRVCDHGEYHPDYDSLVYILDRDGKIGIIHTCCLQKCCGIPEVVRIDV